MLTGAQKLPPRYQEERRLNCARIEYKGGFLEDKNIEVSSLGGVVSSELVGCL